MKYQNKRCEDSKKDNMTNTANLFENETKATPIVIFDNSPVAAEISADPSTESSEAVQQSAVQSTKLGITYDHPIAEADIHREGSRLYDISTTIKETESFTLEDTTRSIFDLSKNEKHSDSHLLPQLVTVFASQEDKKVFEKEPKNCILPDIQAAPQSQNSIGKDKRITTAGKRVKRGLFDFRARAVQEKARKKHIRRLQRRAGCEAQTHSDSSPSRFISNPYEGAVDAVGLITAKKNKSVALLRKESSAKNKGSSSRLEFSPPADETTLAKIETAFSEWRARKKKFAERDNFPVRRRSSSHSPIRSTAEVGSGDKLQSHLWSTSVDFLNLSGNIRRPRTQDLVKKSKAVASPATPRTSSGLKARGRGKDLSTLSTELTAKQLFEGKSTSPRPPARPKHSKPILHRRLADIQSGEATFAASLPDLNSVSSDMETNAYRPRASSFKNGKSSTPGRFPHTRRVNSTDSLSSITPHKESKPKEVKAGALSRQRHVTVNITLPTGSPAFQRAMKTMQLPDKEYSEIFGKNRRDSIVQKYMLTESALNSFRDDNDMKTLDSSSRALDRVTVRFQNDFKLYKDERFGSDKSTKVRKSILKKRRQSVDDMDIGTRKNLTKYLESKLKSSE